MPNEGKDQTKGGRTNHYARKMWTNILSHATYTGAPSYGVVRT